MSATQQNVEDDVGKLFKALDAHFQTFSDPPTAQLIALSCLAPLTSLTGAEERVRARALQMFDAMQPEAAQNGFLEILGTMPTASDGGYRLLDILRSEGEPTPELLSMIGGVIDPSSDLRVIWDRMLEDVVRIERGDAEGTDFAKKAEAYRKAQTAHGMVQEALEAERKKTPFEKRLGCLVSSAMIALFIWLAYRFIVWLYGSL